MSEPPQAQLIHTLSKFHCLIHEIYPSNHHSSQEHALYGTSRLLPFLNLTTCHLSNLRSMNLILSLSPLSCSFSSLFLLSYVGCIYFIVFPLFLPPPPGFPKHSLLIFCLWLFYVSSYPSLFFALMMDPRLDPKRLKFARDLSGNIQ